MFDVRKPKQKPIVVIRAATENELSLYEKHKLANIEEKAQENKIETISLSFGDSNHRLEPLNKEVKIDLGDLAAKDSISPTDISEELFFIKCELDKKTLEDLK